MSTSTSATPAFPLNPPVATSTELHQRNSWGIFAAAWRFIDSWSERRSQRQSLRELIQAPHLLNDIGLTRAQALREAAKPFWRTRPCAVACQVPHRPTPNADPCGARKAGIGLITGIR